MKVLKFVTLLKRRPGMSREAFVDYYEEHHRRIGEKYLIGRAARYVRRYVMPVPNPLTGAVEEPEHDVMTEVWFSDRAAFNATMAILTSPDAAAEIAADEEQLFDRSKHRHFFVDERESQL